MERRRMVAISFDRHLFYPLLGLEDKDAVPLKLRPLALTPAREWMFVRDLEAFYNPAQAKEVMARNAQPGCTCCAMRIGKSALAGNFWPDFPAVAGGRCDRQAVADLYVDRRACAISGSYQHSSRSNANVGLGPKVGPASPISIG